MFFENRRADEATGIRSGGGQRRPGCSGGRKAGSSHAAGSFFPFRLYGRIFYRQAGSRYVRHPAKRGCDRRIPRAFKGSGAALCQGNRADRHSGADKGPRRHAALSDPVRPGRQQRYGFWRSTPSSPFQGNHRRNDPAKPEQVRRNPVSSQKSEHLVRKRAGGAGISAQPAAAGGCGGSLRPKKPPKRNPIFCAAAGTAAQTRPSKKPGAVGAPAISRSAGPGAVAACPAHHPSAGPAGIAAGDRFGRKAGRPAARHAV